MEAEKIWQAALGELELALSKANFTTWFKNTFIASRENETITIAVPNTFTKAWLEKKYHTAILKALQKITDNKIRAIVYRVEAKAKIDELSGTDQLPEEKLTLTIEPTETPALNEFGLNPRYNFT